MSRKPISAADAKRDEVKRATGVTQRFIVRRVDGRDGPGCKHQHCQHFVIDIAHDEFAAAALKAYAKACAKKYPQLARDLEIAAVTKKFQFSPLPPELQK